MTKTKLTPGQGIDARIERLHAQLQFRLKVIALLGLVILALIASL